MSDAIEVLTIPAGVIQPKALLLWLLMQRDAADDERDSWYIARGSDSYEAMLCVGRAQAFIEVLEYIQSGGAS